jgi:hypothetical protein
MKKALVVLAIVAATVPLAGKAYAICGGSVPMIHGLDSYFACDNSKGPVSAFSYLLSAPTTTNTGTEFIAVNLSTDPVNKVQIQTDWGNGGILGCPQDATGNHRVMIVVQATDGTGLLASISGVDASVGYLVETAHTYDGAGGALPLNCTNQNGRPQVTLLTSSAISVKVTPPHIYSDCDPNSVGIAALGDTCPDGFNGASATVGGIYTSTQPCATRPDVHLGAGTLWTKSAVVPDASGNATIPYTKPAADTDCFYVGQTTTVGGTEGGSITGFNRIQGGTVAQPKPENVKVSAASGKVSVSWSTATEVGLAGFRFLTSTKAKGQFEIGSFLAANGTSSYSASFGMGDFKGGRSLIVRAVLTDGTTVDAAAVNF